MFALSLSLARARSLSRQTLTNICDKYAGAFQELS
jgi:hypothetical protein